MAQSVYKVHIHMDSGAVRTAKPAGAPAWTDKALAKTEAMRLVGMAGYQCGCAAGCQDVPEGCTCPHHIASVVVTEEHIIAAYNGPARPGVKHG